MLPNRKKKMLFKKICFVLFFSIFTISSVFAIETKAKYAVVMDFDTGDFIYKKEHDKMVPPASMSKIMTVYILLSKIKDGSLTMEDTFTVSENAWRKGGARTDGSTMFLKIGSKVSVSDILRGIIIQSGNDACIVVAENVSGSEEAFVKEMNKMAKTLGMNNSNFVNSTGLPHPDHRMSSTDLAILSRYIIQDFPEYYSIFSEKEFTHNKIRQGNRNPLLYSMAGADGLKTGHTNEAGYSLTTSVKKNDRRLIAVMSGMTSQKERGEESEKLISWCFREFSNYQILKKGQKIKDVDVWLGSGKKSFGLVSSQDLSISVSKRNFDNIKATVIYDTPVKAPIIKGSQYGILKLEIFDREDIIVPLLADKDIAKKGTIGKIITQIQYILLGVK